MRRHYIAIALVILAFVLPSYAQETAVLLPLTGPYATLGKQVQNGVIAAYYQQAQGNLHFYDTNMYTDFDELYDQLEDEHITFILGPLTKDNVQRFKRAYDGDIPAISLNYLPTGSSSEFYQFGLSPKDEAIQAAKLAWQQGKRHAFVIAPDTEAGQSTQTAFTQTWLALGGTIVQNYRYTTDSHFSADLAAYLGITASKARNDQLQKVLQQKTTFTPQIRHDIDMIFLVADAKTARQLKPILKFHYAEAIPVYATASVYSGSPQAKLDADLDGIYFCDSTLRHDRLYSLGADAYLLSQQTLQPNKPIHGLTGDIYVQSNHQLTRSMPCAQFDNGVPHALT